MATTGATTADSRSPFDDYFLDAEQLRTVEQARIQLTTQCMAGKGFEYSEDINETMSGVSDSTAGLDGATWGPIDLDQARRNGYHAEPEEDSGAPGAATSSAEQQPGYIDALVNDENTGCDDLAYAELGYDDEWYSQIATYDTARATANESAVADPEAVQLFADWSACMSRKGYDADDPRSLASKYLDGSQGTPSAEERETAVADAECKADTSFATTLTGVINRYETQAVTDNQATMDTIKRLSSQIYERAQEVLGS
ncbi:hypothetical protein CWT12_12100 [Actinomyces sp. 432]|uniref:hypothetical protein n=1 Tax=Actinomyces sp. 432 TaxID=2057798 RepID=UPI001373B2D4|nr:hypothetical protein [Actinomyces sp. 432]QHO91895.1 hypothetical protein CWT12_12100 [Actinomyces sp. 432]